MILHCRFLYSALDIVRKRHEYIHLFQMFNDLQMMNRQERYSATTYFDLRNHLRTVDICPNRLSGEYMPLKLRQDQEVQTETHIFPTFIDKDYSSSLWEHRQRALNFVSS